MGIRESKARVARRWTGAPGAYGRGTGGARRLTLEAPVVSARSGAHRWQVFGLVDGHRSEGLLGGLSGTCGGLPLTAAGQSRLRTGFPLASPRGVNHQRERYYI